MNWGDWQFLRLALIVCLFGDSCIDNSCLNGSLVSSATAAEELPPDSQQTIAAEFSELLKNTTPLNTAGTLFLDPQKKCLYVQASVVLQAGLLEMLCCPVQTKEHESILSTSCPPQLVHAGLLALKAEPGKPAAYADDFVPPTGEKLQIDLFWRSAEGKLNKSDARSWIRTATRRYFTSTLEKLPDGLELPEESDLKYDSRNQELLYYGKMPGTQLTEFLAFSVDKTFQSAVNRLYRESQPQPLKADWVFVGSQFQKDERTGTTLYLADGGDFICVANFPTAAIDIAVESSTADANRGYEANSDVVPAAGTLVLIQLTRLADLSKNGQAE